MKAESSKLLKSLARPEFPKLFALASVWIATPLLGICTIVYIQNSLSQPVTKTFPIGLSVFGVTAALSGISFSMARVSENPATPKYAGEKFLHSSILLIQGLFVIYLRDSVGEIDLFKPWPSLVVGIRVFAAGLLTLVTLVAAATWYYGFSELNKFLWKIWEENIQAINVQTDKGVVVPTKVDMNVSTETPSKDATPM